MLNQARLKVLKERDDHVSTVIAHGKRELANISRDQQRYPKIIEGLIAQVVKIAKICHYRNLSNMHKKVCLLYCRLLCSLQGLCQLLESNVTVRCRQTDAQLVQAAVPNAVASVKDKMPKIHCQVELDTQNFLPADW